MTQPIQLTPARRPASHMLQLSYRSPIYLRNGTSLTIGIRRGNNPAQNFRLAAHNNRLFALENSYGLADLINVTEILDGQNYRGVTISLPGRAGNNTVDFEADPLNNHYRLSIETRTDRSPNFVSTPSADTAAIKNHINPPAAAERPVTKAIILGQQARLGVDARLGQAPSLNDTLPGVEISEPALPFQPVEQREITPPAPQAIPSGQTQPWNIDEGQGIILSVRNEAGNYYSIVRNNDRYTIIDAARAARVAEIGVNEYMGLEPQGVLVRVNQDGLLNIENNSAYEVVPQAMMSNHINPTLRSA